jgi:hypothetical protein
VSTSLAQCVVTSYEDDSEDYFKTLPGSDFSKYVMPFVTAFIAFQKRLKTMNKGCPLPADILEWFEENMSKGVAVMSLQDMLDLTVALCSALQLDKPLTEQVSNNSTHIQVG